MEKYSIYIINKNIVILDEAFMANKFITRLKGLIGKKEMKDEQGLIIKPCNSVHTVGMHFPIDVAFINKNNVVIHIIYNMQPKKFSPIIKNSQFVIEAKANVFKNILDIGDKIELIS